MTGTRLHVKRGGSGQPTLLLLHGLGAVGEVWQGLEEVLTERWPGSWVIPDLPGHGRSAKAAEPQRSQFVRDGEPVTALDLKRRRALGPRFCNQAINYVSISPAVLTSSKVM